jgi:ligand-binding sensor domain-containing protein
VWAIRQCWDRVAGEEVAAELAQFDGARWTVYTDADGRAFGSIAGAAVTSQGSLIVASESGLLAHDTAGWTRLLPDSYASVAVGPDDALWLTDPSGIYRYVP